MSHKHPLHQRILNRFNEDEKARTATAACAAAATVPVTHVEHEPESDSDSKPAINPLYTPSALVDRVFISDKAKSRASDWVDKVVGSLRKTNPTIDFHEPSCIKRIVASAEFRAVPASIPFKFDEKAFEELGKSNPLTTQPVSAFRESALPLLVMVLSAGVGLSVSAALRLIIQAYPKFSEIEYRTLSVFTRRTLAREGYASFVMSRINSKERHQFKRAFRKEQKSLPVDARAFLNAAAAITTHGNARNLKIEAPLEAVLPKLSNGAAYDMLTAKRHVYADYREIFTEEERTKYHDAVMRVIPQHIRDDYDQRTSFRVRAAKRKRIESQQNPLDETPLDAIVIEVKSEEPEQKKQRRV